MPERDADEADGRTCIIAAVGILESLCCQNKLDYILRGNLGYGKLMK